MGPRKVPTKARRNTHVLLGKPVILLLPAQQLLLPKLDAYCGPEATLETVLVDVV